MIFCLLHAVFVLAVDLPVQKFLQTVFLPEDMEQLQNCEYIFREDAMWVRYGSKLHEELQEHRLQELLDREIYCEDENGMQ